MLRRLFHYLISIYGVSRSEARGFTILIPILFIVISTPLWFSYLFDADNALDERYHREFKEWIAESETSIQKKETTPKKETVKEPAKYYKFDPNTATVSELTKLGFKPWVAERIEKYRMAGGKFKSADDLKKIYGISEEHLKTLKGYVKIELLDISFEDETSDNYNNKNRSYTARSKVSIKDINSLMAEDLVFVRGIGPVLSERIVKYRDMLGGFSNLDQINEVYGLESSVADSLKLYIYSDTTSLKKLKINYLKADELRKHPYISYKLANALEQYRIQHGDYSKPEDLLSIKIMDDSTFQKILPYLKIE